MKLLSFIFFALILTSQNAISSEDDSSELVVKQLMVVSKFAGACGIFSLQLQFQENTKMDKGFDFLDRFWSVEAARLGLSLEEYAEECVNNSEKHKMYSEILE